MTARRAMLRPVSSEIEEAIKLGNAVREAVRREEGLTVPEICSRIPGNINSSTVREVVEVLDGTGDINFIDRRCYSVTL